jgi:DNA-binding transcriptional LysR family regulator
LDIRTLEDFVTLDSTKSFTVAARLRNSTLSAFTRRIRKLEDTVGATLVDRRRLPVQLTRAGEMFLPVARDTIGQLRKVQREIADSERGADNVIYFALPHTLVLLFFPSFFNRVREKIGSVEAQLLISTIALNMTDILDRNLCHFAIYFYHPDVPAGLDARKNPSVLIGYERLVPVSMPDDRGRPVFPIPGRPELPTPHLYQGPDSYIGQILDTAFERRGVDLHLRQLPHREGTIMFPDAVKQGLGAAWVPELSVAGELASGNLVAAADPDWIIPLEIRLARSAHILPEKCMTLWSTLASEEAHSSISSVIALDL